MSELIEVDFRPKDGDVDDVGLRVKRRDYAACQHTKYVIDEVLRRIGCSACGEQLDPIEVLIFWATRWERYEGAVRALREEQRRREDTIVALKVEHARLMAQIRRARETAKSLGACGAASGGGTATTPEQGE